MYIYEYYLKNGTRHLFYTDGNQIPNEVINFVENNKNEITGNYCDHFPMTIKEFRSEIEEKEYGVTIVICD